MTENNMTIYKNLIIRVLLICGFIFCMNVNTAVAAAWADKDTTATNISKDAENGIFVAGSYGKNAIDYIMSKRYRHPSAVEHSSRGFLSHLFLGGSFSFDFLAPRGDYTYHPGISWGINVGKELSATHSLALQYFYGGNNDKDDRAKFKRQALQLSHYFNFTRYYLGYDPSRLFELSSMLGVGVQRGEIWDKRSDSPYLSLGAKATFRMGNNVHLVVEPHVALAGEGYSGEEEGYWYSGYNASYGVGTSINYTFENELSKAGHVEKMPFSRNYMFLTTGLQSLKSDISFSRTLGPMLSIGYGYWLSPLVGVQVSGGYSSGGWTSYAVDAADAAAYTLYPKTQYVFGRIEPVFNIFSSFDGMNKSGRGVSLSLMGGYEFGRLWKYRLSLDNQTVDSYNGFTGALRLKYHSVEGKTLFIEPRVTFAEYGALYGEEYVSTEKSRIDSRWSLALGMEYGLQRPRGSSEKSSVPSDEFTPRFAVSLSGGPVYIFNRDIYSGGGYMDGGLSLGVEYQPFRLFGVRGLFDYSLYSFSSIENYRHTGVDGLSTVHKGLWHKQYHTLSGIFDLKFDLSNALFGYDASRRWHSSLYMGLVVSRHRRISSEIDESEVVPSGSRLKLLREPSEENFPGFHTSFSTRYNLSRRLSLFGEVDLRMYGNEYISEHSVDYRPVRTMAFRGGIDYDLNFPYIVKSFQSPLPFSRDYLFISTGFQSLNSDIRFSRTLGPSVNIGYGHWFTRRFGVQLSGGYSSGGWISYPVASGKEDVPPYTLYPKSQYGYGRIEGVVNVYSSRSVSDGFSGGLSLNLMGGYEMGSLWKYRTEISNQTTADYAGFTGGLRLRYHGSEGKNLFFEPRVTFANYSGARSASRQDPSRIDSRWSLALGMEYGLLRPRGSSDKSSVPSDEFTPRFAVSLSGGPVYIFNRDIYSGGRYLDGGLSLGLEYQPFRLFGVRGLFDYSLYSFSSIENYRLTGVDGLSTVQKGLWHKQYHTLSGIFDLKFDLSNALFGYEASRRWHSSLYMGLVVSRHRRISSEINESEVVPSGSRLKLLREPSEENFPGFHTSFSTRYTLSRRLSLFGEVDLRMYGNEYISEHSVDYRPVRTMAFRGGISFDLK